MNAYLLSHNGIGDNLYMIGAVRYLLQYYEKMYFIFVNTEKFCKEKMRRQSWQ